MPCPAIPVPRPRCCGKRSMRAKWRVRSRIGGGNRGRSHGWHAPLGPCASGCWRGLQARDRPRSPTPAPLCPQHRTTPGARIGVKAPRRSGRKVPGAHGGRRRTKGHKRPYRLPVTSAAAFQRTIALSVSTRQRRRDGIGSRHRCGRQVLPPVLWVPTATASAPVSPAASAVSSPNRRHSRVATIATSRAAATRRGRWGHVSRSDGASR